MKYFSGVFLFVFAALFLLLSISLLLKVSLEDLYEEPMLLGGFLIFWFGILFLKGAYYCFKFSDLFTKKIIFSNQSISISSKGGVKIEISTKKIISVVHVKYLKLFEIHFDDKRIKEIIVMNNGRYETASFKGITEYLLDSPVLTVKWL